MPTDQHISSYLGLSVLSDVPRFPTVTETRKRDKSSSKISQAESEKHSRRHKAGRSTMTSGGGFDFDPASKPATYIPSTLAAPEAYISGVTLFLPIVIQSKDHETFQITMEFDQNQTDRCFWTMLGNKIQQMEPIMAEYHFDPVKPEDLTQLKVGSSLMTKLLGQDGRLMYDTSTKEGRIVKPNYKPFLKMVDSNMKALLTNMKEDRSKATQQSPLTKQGVARELQSGL